MQQVQEKLDFNIEVPGDKELAKRFADRQKTLTISLNMSSRNYKKRQRKNAKKRARQHG